MAAPFPSEGPGAGRPRLEVVDAQVHTWESESPRWPWDPTYGQGHAVAAVTRAANRASPVPHTALVEAMDAAGVDAALIVTSSIYGYDNGYSFDAVDRHPGRFGVVGKLDPGAAGLEEAVTRWRDRPGALGLRVVATSALQRAQLESGHFDRLFGLAERFGVPVCVYPPRALGLIPRIAARFSELTLVIDHLGLAQPPLMEPDPEPWMSLPELLALARYPNVAVKLTAVPSLSGRPHPYPDVWPAVHQVLDAFGLDRALWGSDWTRVRPLLGYREGVTWILESSELSRGDKERLLGLTLRRLFRWDRSLSR